MSMSTLIGWGHALPEERITNSELGKSLGIDPEEIFQKTGIRTRARATNESLVDLARRASEIALKKAGVSAEDIDLIVFALSVPPQPMPATANLLQRALGNSRCLAFDLNASCTGFKYGLTVVDGLLRSGTVKTALLIGGDLGTQMVDYSRTGPSIIFGDGAGAFVLSSSKKAGILAHVDRTQSQYADELCIKSGGFMEMNGPRVFAQAVSEMALLCQEVCEKAQVPLTDVDWIIPHQANYRILEAVGWKLPLPPEKIIVDLEDIGNTAAGTLPIAFSRAHDRGLIRSKELVLFVSFAAGFSGGATLMRLP